MELSHIRGLTEMGMEDPGFIQQWSMNNSLDQLSTMTMATVFGDGFLDTFGHQGFDVKPYTDVSHIGTDRPRKQLKTQHWDSYQQSDSTSTIVSFNTNYTNQVGLVKPKEETVSCEHTQCTGLLPKEEAVSFRNHNYVLKNYQGNNRISSTTRLSQDHIMAERKRREKLSQRLIALSALIPGLKKMDKASVLGDAIKYLKQLQEQVKTLEEQTRKKSMESVVLVKKYEVYSDGDNSSSDENCPTGGGGVSEPLPEIEARFSDKDVLLRIHCERKRGVLEKTVAEIEKLNLSVINSSAMSFGPSALDITIIAQMDVEFSCTVKDFVKNLHLALKQFM